VITGLSHVSIAVPSLAVATARLRELYGLAAGAPVVNEEQGIRLAYIELGNARIELMEPVRPDSPISKFLERHPGGGMHHFCLEVDGLVPAAAAIEQKGGRVLGEAGTARNVRGELIAFVHPKDFLGALVELEERKA